MDKKLIYVAGKYGGNPENKKLIEEVIKYLKKQDKSYYESGCGTIDGSEYVYFSPVHAFDMFYEDTEYYEALDYCLTVLERSDKAIFLSNFEESTGAKIEYGFCKGHGIPFEIFDLSRLNWWLEKDNLNDD